MKKMKRKKNHYPSKAMLCDICINDPHLLPHATYATTLQRIFTALIKSVIVDLNNEDN